MLKKIKLKKKESEIYMQNYRVYFSHEWFLGFQQILKKKKYPKEALNNCSIQITWDLLLVK